MAKFKLSSGDNRLFRLSSGDDRFPRENENSGNDTVLGLRGDDVIHGGRGDDQLRGGRGDDALKGGSGYNTLKGGPGSDDFIIEKQKSPNGMDASRSAAEAEGKPLPDEQIFHSDTILDFSEEEGDVLVLRGFGDELDSFAEFRSRAVDSVDFDGDGVNDTRVALANGQELLILDVSIQDLKGDVVFG